MLLAIVSQLLLIVFDVPDMPAVTSVLVEVPCVPCVSTVAEIPAVAGTVASSCAVSGFPAVLTICFSC